MGKTLLIRTLCFELQERKRFSNGILRIDATGLPLDEVARTILQFFEKNSKTNEDASLNCLLEFISSNYLDLLIVIKTNDCLRDLVEPILEVSTQIRFIIICREAIDLGLNE